MKTINVYSFYELSEEAKQKAIQDFREDYQEVFWQDEIFKSLEALFEVCNNIKMVDYSLGEYNSYLKVEFSRDEIAELKGKRAMAWIENNLLCELRIQEGIHAKYKDYIKYGQYYRSGLIKSCPFTGYCADEDYLESLINDIKLGYDLKTCFESLAQVYEKLINQEIEYQNSGEFISEHLQVNEYEFLENGQQI